jgi:hypothetical protein
VAQISGFENIINLIEVIWDCDLRKKHSALNRPSVCLVMKLALPGPPGPAMVAGSAELFYYVAVEPFQDALAHYYFKQLVSGAFPCMLQRLLR